MKQKEVKKPVHLSHEPIGIAEDGIPYYLNCDLRLSIDSRKAIHEWHSKMKLEREADRP